MELALDYRIYKSYQVEGKIGNGVYGEVYKAWDKRSQRGVAIKKIIDAFQNLTDAKRTYRQLSYLLQLSHPCIIKLQRVISSSSTQVQHVEPNKNVYAVFQLMELDLAKTIHLCQIQLLQRKYIAAQILAGLQYLHESDLVHRDIKPSNILVDKSCNAKICDFGLIRKITHLKKSCKRSSKNQQQKQHIFTEYVASRWYRAPQLLLNGNQLSTSSLDMWSFGCVLAEMILGHPIFDGKNTIEQLQKIMVYTGMPLEQQIEQIAYQSQNATFLLKNFHKLNKKQLKQLLGATGSTTCPSQIDLVQKLLVFNPKRRIGASQALKHPYFSQIAQIIKGIEQQSVPVKIVDHSENSTDQSLGKYRQLIEGLCVNTLRGTSCNSSSDSSWKYNSFQKYKYRKQQDSIINSEAPVNMRDSSSDRLISFPTNKNSITSLTKYEIEAIQQHFPIENSNVNQEKSTRQSNRAGYPRSSSSKLQQKYEDCQTVDRKYHDGNGPITTETAICKFGSSKQHRQEKEKNRTRLSLTKKQQQHNKDQRNISINNNNRKQIIRHRQNLQNTSSYALKNSHSQKTGQSLHKSKSRTRQHPTNTSGLLLNSKSKAKSKTISRNSSHDSLHYPANVGPIKKSNNKNTINKTMKPIHSSQANLLLYKKNNQAKGAQRKLLKKKKK